MKLPNEIIVGGIRYDIIVEGELYDHNTHQQLDGEVSFSKKSISIATKQRYILGNKDVDIEVRDDVILRTFFHELWHAYCMALWETEIDTEQNCCTFATLCICEGTSGQHYTDWQKHAIDSMIDKKFIVLSEIQKGKLKWLIENVTYRYVEE